MVLKRIISCLAIISVVFLMSCYDVAYDKDDGSAATSGNWFDGLSQAEVIKWMGVTAEPVTDSSASKSDGTASLVNTPEEVEISWECPINSDEWIIKSSDNINASDDDWVTYNPIKVVDVDAPISKSGSIELVINKQKIECQGYYVWKYWCCIPIPQFNVVKYFKVRLLDNNNNPMDTIVSFVVLPHSANLKVTLKSAEQNASSKLNFHQKSICGNVETKSLFTSYKDVKAALAGNPIEPDVNVTLSPLKCAYFSIKSDFSYCNISEKFTHYSNTSFCKVTKVDGESGSGIVATLTFNFEDLPKNLKHLEPSASFDYNDVVFTVDILGNSI